MRHLHRIGWIAAKLTMPKPRNVEYMATLRESTSAFLTAIRSRLAYLPMTIAYDE